MHEELGTGPGFYYLWDKEERHELAWPPKALTSGRPAEGT